MARLTRKNINVFAGSASNNGVFGSLQAGNATVSNDVETIQSLSEAWSGGWNYATLTGEKLPPLEEFQGVQYVTTYQQAYLMQEGLPEWSATVTYYKGCLAKKVTTTGFQIYNSLTDNNTNHQLSDTSNWKLVMDSDNLYAFDNAVVHLAGAETITGEKTFSTIVKTNGIRQYSNNVTKGTAPSSTQYINMYMTDSSQASGDANALGLFRTFVTSTGAVNSVMEAFKNVSGSSAHIELKAVYDTANNSYWGQIGAGSAGTDTNYSLSYATSATDNLYIPTMGWVNNPATSTNVVHRSGAETITGAKTFTSNITQSNSAPREILKNTDCVKGTAPTNNEAMSVQFRDTNDNILGTVQTDYLTSKKTVTQLRVYKAQDSSDSASISLGIGYDASGNPYSWAPTPSLSSSSSDYNGQIVNVGYLDGANSGVVHRSGTETITGIKKFTSNPYVSNSEPRVFLTNSDVIRGTAPSANEVSAFQYRDNNNDLLGSVHNQYKTDKSIVTQLVTYKANNASDTASARMGVGYDASGNVITYAPACEEENSIVTTVSKSKSSNGYFKLGNGMIVQWGSVTASNQALTITLPTAFTTTNYSLGAMCDNSKAAYSTSQTTTTFALDASGGIGGTTIKWIAIGY